MPESVERGREGMALSARPRRRWGEASGHMPLASSSESSRLLLELDPLSMSAMYS